MLDRARTEGRLVLLATIAVALLSAIASPAAHAEPLNPPSPTWVPDGEIKAVTISGATAYIGGNFGRIAPYTGSSARFDASSAALKPWPEVDGVVNDVVSDNAGGWYIGGDFRSVGGVARTDLAHVRSDGALDPNWAPTTNGQVRALAVGNGVVIAGGDFSSASGIARGDLASFDSASGALTNFTGSVSAAGFIDPPGVYRLLLEGTTLYVTGEFDGAQGTTSATRNRGAAFDITNSQLLAWDPNTNRLINSIVRSGSALFIGGRFTKANASVDRFGMAKLNDSTGALDNSWVAPAPCCNDLTAMAVSGTSLYVAGSIHVSAMETWQAAAFHTDNAGLKIAWRPVFAGGVLSMTTAGSTVYIGSTSFTGGVQPAIAGFDATTGAATGFAPALGRGKLQLPSGQEGGVTAIGVSGTDIVAGGTFINAGGVARRNLAAIDLTTGEATGFNPPMNGQFAQLASVQAIALADGLVWAGGDFVTEGPDPRTGLAAFDAGTGALASFKRDPNTTPVRALVASGSTVYAAGDFTSLGSTPRRHVAAVRHFPGEIGTVLPFDVDADGPVRTLALTGNTLFLGGTFTNINAGLASHLAPRRNLAAVDSATGDALPWDPDADGAVYALSVAGDTVIAGGEFALVNRSTPRQRLAAFDAQSGAARAWAPSADGPVRALAVREPTVFAGGDFENVNGAGRAGLAALDAQTGASDALSVVLAPEERDGPLPPVTRVGALAMSPEAGLLAGGSFVMSTPALRAANLGRFSLPPLPAPAGPEGTPLPVTSTPRDTTAPTLSSFTSSRRRFRVAPGTTRADGNAVAAARKAPRGTTLALRLSEPARVRFEALSKSRGRRVGKRCIKPTRRNRSRKACTRLTLRGSFTRSAPVGRSKVAFSGRIGRKALKPGGYTIRATPTDTAGNAGKPRSVSITIVP